MFCKVKDMVFLFFLSLVFLFLPEVAGASMYDNFLNEAASENLWFYEDENNIANYNETDGLVKINAANSDEEADIISKYCFSGNFDVMMKYYNWSLKAATSAEEDWAPAHIASAVTSSDSFHAMENDHDPRAFDSNFTEPVVIGAIAYSGKTPLLSGGF